MSFSARVQSDHCGSRRDMFRTLCVLCAILAAIPLFAKSFTIDWVNHTWMINYQARYLINHFSFPPTLNTTQIIGLPYPIFYGYLFFPVMALCSTIFDADMTVRFFALALFCAQALLAYTSLVKLTEDRRFSFIVAVILIWAIYPLTNLYHRAALPEFFATGLLTCSCIAWIRAICSDRTSQLRKWCNFAVLCLCAAAGTHPITAIYGICFFLILVGLSFLLKPPHRFKDIAIALLIPAAISTLCLAPWVMMAGKNSRKLQIAQSFHVIGFYPMTIDFWLTMPRSRTCAPGTSTPKSTYRWR
jgi:hypothetical protein